MALEKLATKDWGLLSKEQPWPDRRCQFKIGTEEKDEWSRIQQLNSRQLHTNALFLFVYAPRHLFVFADFCTVWPSMRYLPICTYLLEQGRATGRKAAYGILYDHTAGTPRLKLIWVSDIKAQGLGHRDQRRESRWDVRVCAVEHMFFVCVVCVRGVFEREGAITRQGGGGGVTMETISTSAPGFSLDWPPSPPPPLLKLYSSLPSSFLLPPPPHPHPWARLTFWTKWHYKVITLFHLFQVQWKTRWKMLVLTRVFV